MATLTVIDARLVGPEDPRHCVFLSKLRHMFVVLTELLNVLLLAAVGAGAGSGAGADTPGTTSTQLSDFLEWTLGTEWTLEADEVCFLTHALCARKRNSLSSSRVFVMVHTDKRPVCCPCKSRPGLSCPDPRPLRFLRCALAGSGASGQRPVRRGGCGPRAASTAARAPVLQVRGMFGPPPLLSILLCAR